MNNAPIDPALQGQAEVFEPAVLAALLEQKIDLMQRRDAKYGDIEGKKSFQVILNVQRHVQHLIEMGAGQVDNLGLAAAELQLADAPDYTSKLSSFEQVQIATLMPASADEARALIPSLDRFDAAQLAKLIESL